MGENREFNDNAYDFHFLVPRNTQGGHHTPKGSSIPWETEETEPSSEVLEIGGGPGWPGESRLSIPARGLSTGLITWWWGHGSQAGV